MKTSIVPAEIAAAPATGANGLQRLARRAVLARLARLREGAMELIDGPQRFRFGANSATCKLRCTVTVADPQFYADLAYGGSVGAGEGYIHGTWSCSDLTALVRIMARNLEIMYDIDGGWARLRSPLLRFAHWLNRNSLKGSRDNIAAHYDLGNELFQLFLDDTMMYSCAVFATEDMPLAQASRAKNELICRKLDLGPEDHLLEIGTGWGGFALHAASRYGCRVTTTTISQAQHDFASERIRAAGLGDRVTLLQEDYRDLRGRYDKLVSIEMIEAVGHQYFDTYFSACSRLLEPDGLMLLQAITINDQQYETARDSVDFIKRYIFPGSCLPSVAAISDAIARVTDLRLVHLDDIGPHYARTLRHWRERFLARRSEVRALGYSEGFIRMWEYYLCYCEGGFEERNIGDVQMLFSKPLARRAPLAGAPAIG